MKKVATVVMTLCVLYTASGQDFHFAQSDQVPLLINPATAGVFEGWERIGINHRTQWVNTGTQFLSTSIAADANLWKSARRNTAHAGVGVLFFNDIGGDSKFGNQLGSLTFNGILPTGKTSTISLGIQTGLGQRKADLSHVSFLNQWDGVEFDENQLSGEQNVLPSFIFMDASAGLFYVYSGKKNLRSRNSDFKFKIGVAGHHLNKPKLRYVNGSIDRLSRKFVVHASILGDIPGTKFAMDGSVLQFAQGGHLETLLGIRTRYRFEDGKKSRGMNHNSYAGFGLQLRLKDAIIPSLLLDIGGVKFVLSYDITISELRSAYSGGSIEFSITYVNKHRPLFRTGNK
ncbi:MAG: type IX secretion system PorP/SprF family membrane protein [Crocinitomicaceae bacterium]|jgi:type IX secretion system PorP/SprF family membrane protein